MQNKYGFNADEVNLLRRLNTPERLQNFIDEIPYHYQGEDEVTYSPRLVMSKNQSDCLEGAIFAAAVFRFHGERPLVMNLEAVRDDSHCIALFERHGCWGAIGKSKYTGLTFREPIHRTLRELALSYVEGYFNFDGEKTLRGYSKPFDLSRFDNTGWMTTEKDITEMGLKISNIPYTILLTPKQTRGLRAVVPLMLRAGELGMTESGILENAKKKFKA